MTTPSDAGRAGERCGEHYGRHPDLPHLIAVCALPLGHDGEHTNVLPKTLASLITTPTDPEATL